MDSPRKRGASSPVKAQKPQSEGDAGHAPGGSPSRAQHASEIANSPLRSRAKLVEDRLTATPAQQGHASPEPARKSSGLRVPLQHRCLLTLAANALHAGQLPTTPSLPCRESEQREIEAFLHGCLSSGKPGNLYISGSPGVGKTAVTSRILASLPAWCASRGLLPPILHSYNGLTTEWTPAQLQGMIDGILKSVRAGVSSRAGGNIATLAEAEEVDAEEAGASDGGSTDDDDDDAEEANDSNCDGDGDDEEKDEEDGRAPKRKRSSSVKAPTAKPGRRPAASPSPLPVPSVKRVPTSPLAALSSSSSSNSKSAASAAVGGGGKHLKMMQLALSRTKWALTGQAIPSSPLPSPGASPSSAAAGAKRARSESSAGASGGSPGRGGFPVSSKGDMGNSPARALSKTPPRPAAAAATPSVVVTPPKSSASGSVKSSKSAPGASPSSVSSAAKSPSTGRTSSKTSSAASSPSSSSSGIRQPLHIVVIDELDGLLRRSDKHQAALLQLFQQPHKTGSRIVVVGIANAVAMTEKFLPVLRRVGASPEVVVFRPYSDSQIAEIIRHRLASASEAHAAAVSAAEATAAAGGCASSSPSSRKKSAAKAIASASAGSVDPSSSASQPQPPSPPPQQQLMDPSSILYLSKRVSAKSGDLRRALDIARKAIMAAAYAFCDSALPILSSSSGCAADDDGDEGMLDGGGALGADADDYAISRAGLAGLSAADDVDTDDSLFPASSSASSAAGGGSPGRRKVASTAHVMTGSSSSSNSSSSSIDAAGNAPLCSCCSAGLAWQRPAPAAPVVSSSSAASSSSSSSSSAVAAAPAPGVPHRKQPQPFAVALRDVIPLMDALERKYTASLQSLPRQGLLLVCAARALAEKEAKEALARKEARDCRLDAHYIGAYEGASTLSEAAKGRKKAEAKEPAAGSNAISARSLENAYVSLCKKRLMAPVAAQEFTDLLNRLVDDGILARQSKTGRGSNLLSGASAGASAAAASSVGGGLAFIRVQVQLADLDAALTDSPLYQLLAKDIRSGVI